MLRSGLWQPAVVVDESQLPEPIHEKAHSRAGRADHLGQGLGPAYAQYCSDSYSGMTVRF
jgi:hypothetical protein